MLFLLSFSLQRFVGGFTGMNKLILEDAQLDASGYNI
jgi:hypothetical protein